jgi:lipid-binding SYLF domain-containing protein
MNVLIKRFCAVILGSALAGLLWAPTSPAKAKDEEQKENDRIQNAGTVVKEILDVPDNIPQDLLDKARCMIVFPSVLKAAFVVGGSYGRGVMVCRTHKDYTGPWGAPAMMALEGGSFGLQIGGQATDVVMLIMNKNGMDNLLSSQFKLGADASAAAGPVGRHAAADTDWKMKAQVLTYSRSRGLFAGLELNGAVIKQDKDSTREFYGRMVPFKTSLQGEIEAPKAAYPFLSTLAKWAQLASK